MMESETSEKGLRSDFFESRIVTMGEINWIALKGKLSRLVEEAHEKSSDAEERRDYQLVLSYLANPILHDSEGRDPKVEKHSFSRSELRTANTYDERLIPRYLRYRVRFDRHPRDFVVSDLAPTDRRQCTEHLECRLAQILEFATGFCRMGKGNGYNLVHVTGIENVVERIQL